MGGGRTKDSCSDDGAGSGRKQPFSLLHPNGSTGEPVRGRPGSTLHPPPSLCPARLLLHLTTPPPPHFKKFKKFKIYPTIAEDSRGIHYISLGGIRGSSTKGDLTLWSNWLG